jgi:cytochrome P450
LEYSRTGAQHPKRSGLFSASTAHCVGEPLNNFTARVAGGYFQHVNQAVNDFTVQARTRLSTDPARRASPPNLLEAMIIAADGLSNGIDDQQVAGNVMTMLLAGEDTTANTLAWMLYLMWHNPATLAGAVAEVQSVVGDNASPSSEQI